MTPSAEEVIKRLREELRATGETLRWWTIPGCSLSPEELRRRSRIRIDAVCEILWDTEPCQDSDGDPDRYRDDPFFDDMGDR